MEKIYNVHKSILRNMYLMGFIPLIVVCIFYIFIDPIFTLFEDGSRSAIDRFLLNQREIFTYDFLISIELWCLILFGIIYDISLYYRFRNYSKQAKLFENKFEITLFSNDIIVTKYEDVLEICYNNSEMFIKTKEQDSIHVINDLDGYEEFCSFITQKVKKFGGKVKVIK